MARRNAQAQVQQILETSPFSPAYTDQPLQYVRGQIWSSPPRLSRDSLIADCTTKAWADSLASAFNSTPAKNLKIDQAQTIIKGLLDALTEVAAQYQESDPQMYQNLNTVVSSFKTQATNAGYNVQ